MSVEGKCQALAFYVSIRICYMFWNSKCKGEYDLGLCTTSGLAKRMPLRSAIFWLNRKICWKSALRSRILFVSPTVVRKPRLHSLLHYDSENIYQIRMETQILVLGVCFLQPFSSAQAGCSFAASRSRLQYYEQIISFPQHEFQCQWMRCKLDSTENPRSLEIYPTPPQWRLK